MKTALAALLTALTAALLIGTRDIDPASALAALTGAGDPIDRAVLLDIRLPRVLAAALTGAALAVAGALMQGLTRNPFASPSIAGLNVGAALAMLTGMLLAPDLGALGLMLLAFAGATAAAATALLLGALGTTPGHTRLVLVGATVNLTLGAAIVGVVVHFQLHMDLLFWTTGGLMGTTWEQLATLAPATALGLAAAHALAPAIGALTLGADTATGLGLRPARTRAAALAAVVLLAGGAVAVIGPIGFIGLIVPHLARRLAGADPRRVIPLCAPLGAAVLTLADLAVRSLAADIDLPLGSVTALIGAAVFVALVLRRRTPA